MAKKEKNIQYYESVGRRKRSIARVRLYLINSKNNNVEINGVKINKGEIIVNFKPLEKVFFQNYERDLIKKPLKITNNEDRFAISIIVKGGGFNGQKEAIIHGIAKALILVDNNYKPLLKKANLLTRDSRKKERRKVGTGGKARREKQSPKR
ncbi:MAG: 30S ribosomal protein S9 [Patescibacteria group bacterium]|nr:30S ribosomal protein S9 [Patescibacteria group bacterium]